METLTEAQQELYDWLVEYINQHHYAPSIRQMMRAMNLKSPAPVQSRLDHLREKGYITWSDGKARTYRILRSPKETEPSSSVPILGAIAAGCMVEPYTDSVEKLDLANALPPKTFALRVMGDSMIEDHIADGDLVILCPVAEPDKVKNGTIVAARVEGHGTTLKRFYRKSDRVILKPANVKYKPIEASAEEVQLQGTLFGVWRNY